MSTTMTVKQTANELGLSRVRVLGLVKSGKLVGKKSNIPGTDIPQVLIDTDSVRNYVPSRSYSGQRSMIVSLPADELDELMKIAEENGWTIRAKNVHNND